MNKLIFITFLSVSFQASAQEPVIAKTWTLEECINYALDNNIQIQQSKLNADLSHVNLNSSEGQLLPSVNANASHSYNIGQTVDRYTNKFANSTVLSQNFSVSADVNIFSGWQNMNSIKEGRYNYMAAKFDTDKMRNDVSLNVATAYLQVLFSMELLENANNQMGITMAQVERTRKLVEAGSVAKGTLLDIQAQLASEELNVTTAQNQKDIAILSLAQLLNLPSSQGFSVAKPELTVNGDALLAANADQIYNTAIGNLPEVKSADLKVKSAEKGVDVAWGGLSPRLVFSASYGTGYSGAAERAVGTPQFQGYAPDGSFTNYNLTDTVYSPVFSTPTSEKIPFSDQFHDNVNKSFGLYLTVPIFNKFQTRSAIDRARIQKMNAELEVISTKLAIQKNVQQAYADASAGLKKYTSSQKAVEAMEESFKYTEQKFNVGMLNTNDYNDSKNKLAKAQSDLLQAKYEYVFKTKVLDFYQGKPLKL